MSLFLSLIISSIITKNEERKPWERSKKDTVTLKIRIGQNKLCFLNIDRFVFVVTLIHPQKIDRNR